MPSRLLLILVALLAIADSPAVAGAATPPRDAQFSGATSDGQALRFRTSTDGKRVTAIGFASRSVRCRTGKPVTLQVRFDKRPRVRAGRFEATVVIRPRGMVTRVTLKGRFTSVHAARGTFRQRITFTSGRRCDTGTVSWTAWRYGATPPPVIRAETWPPPPELSVIASLVEDLPMNCWKHDCFADAAAEMLCETAACAGEQMAPVSTMAAASAS